MMTHRGRAIAASVLVALICLATAQVTVAGDRLVVGAKNFTEQYVLGNMMSLILKDAGFTVTEQFGTSSMVTRQGLVTGQTDLYMEYTGTAWAVYLGHADEIVNDPVELYEKVKREDLESNGIVWLDRGILNNTYALAIRRSDVGKYGETLSELAEYVNSNPGSAVFAIDHEFYERADGFWEMAKTYGLEVGEECVKTMDIGLTFEAINRGQVDVAMVFATDGKIRSYDLEVLNDDMNFFPVYNVCVTVREDVVEKHPEITKLLRPLSELLDDETMQELNYRVDSQGIPARIVASQFLSQNGLID